MIDRILTFVENFSIGLLTLSCLLVSLINTISQQVFGVPLVWWGEFSKVCITYIVFMGCSATIRGRSMIKIDPISQIYPAAAPILNVLHYIGLITYCLIITYLGWKFTMFQSEVKIRLLSLDLPYSYLYAVIPVTGIMMFIRTVQNIAKDLFEVRTRCFDNEVD
ncbi:MAG: TRAP transporter small permease [Deltaproteobacteria bacterium]|nr:TRAP transporter small permease [Deltaproteobacteria bacterium]